MELEELKLKWNELDSRLAQVETMNAKAVKELVTMRTGGSLANLRNHMWYAALSCVFVTAVMLVFFRRDAEIQQIMNPASIQAMLVFLFAGSAYGLFRALTATRMNITDPTGKLIRDTARLKKCLAWENLVLYGSVLVLYAVVFFLERGWIIERGRVIYAILLFAALCALIVFAYFRSRKRRNELLAELESNLRELDELG